MNKRYPNRIDIAFKADEIAEARQWGVRKRKVWIIEL